MIVKKLIKVVLDDIDYEIASTMDYVSYLEKELDRYKKIEKYIQKKNDSKKQNDILYYEQYIDMLLEPNESVDNFENLYQEFKEAYQLRKDMLDNLHKEIKIVKQLKV